MLSIERLEAEQDQGSSTTGVTQQFTATFHALGSILNISEPQFPQLESGDTDPYRSVIMKSKWE